MSVVRLGRACGKTKYVLLDEADLNLCKKYTFEPKVEVDRNGDRARIFAWAFDQQHGRGSGKYLHELLWLSALTNWPQVHNNYNNDDDNFYGTVTHHMPLQGCLNKHKNMISQRSTHKGGVAHGHSVAHKNGITMDNRLNNLVLVNANDRLSRTADGQRETEYWEIIRQIKADPIQEFMCCSVTSGNRFYSADGDSFRVEDGSTVFYECHNPPCCSMERIVRQFNMCGRCRLVRYCSAECQELDWAFHKMFCQQQTLPKEEMLDR